MKLTYKKQLIVTVVIIILFHILNTVSENWIWSSVGHGLCGLLWIVHPVVTKNIESTKRNLMIVRLAGVLLVVMGFFVRFHF